MVSFLVRGGQGVDTRVRVVMTLGLGVYPNINDIFFLCSIYCPGLGWGVEPRALLEAFGLTGSSSNSLMLPNASKELIVRAPDPLPNNKVPGILGLIMVKGLFWRSRVQALLMVLESSAFCAARSMA